jgi:hypothetical protein
MVDKAALGQGFSEYIGSPATHFTNFSIIIITRGWHNRPISGRSAEWTQLDFTLHYTNLKKRMKWPGHVTRMGIMRNSYAVLVETSMEATMERFRCR